MQKQKGLNFYVLFNIRAGVFYQMRGEAERFISDKARIASILNSFKMIHFIPILSDCLRKSIHYRCCIRRGNRDGEE